MDETCVFYKAVCFGICQSFCFSGTEVMLEAHGCSFLQLWQLSHPLLRSWALVWCFPGSGCGHLLILTGC